MKSQRRSDGEFLGAVCSIVREQSMRCGLQPAAAADLAQRTVAEIRNAFAGSKVYVARQSTDVARAGAEVAAARARGMPVVDIAARRGISRGHAYRLLARNATAADFSQGVGP